MRQVVRLTVLSAVAVVVAYRVRARGAIDHWGATREELCRALPGDELVSAPDLSLTRAITIMAPPDRVFPWLAQLGQGRGGFYSYDWLENRTGLNIHSADQVLPEYQELRPGDQIPLAPGPPFYGFLVANVAAPTRLVLEMRIHPFTGLPFQPGASARSSSIHATWAFALAPIDDTSTRLISRTRASLRLPFGLKHLYGVALGAIEFVMERRMLLGIRERAERLETRSAAAGVDGGKEHRDPADPVIARRGSGAGPRPSDLWP